MLDVEIVCSDRAEHQRRVKARLGDIAGHVVPTWQSVMTREFAPWPEPHLVIDTASFSPEEAIMKICQEIRR